MRRVLETHLAARSLPHGLHSERVQWLYDGLAPAAGSPSANTHLLYWMQTSVRARYNYALEYAVAAANALALPLHVVYFLSDRSVVPPTYAPRDPNAFGVATERHAKFALEGLASVAAKLAARGLNFQVFHHSHRSTAGTQPLDFWVEEDPVVAEDRANKAECPSRSDVLDLCARGAALVITDRPYLRPLKDALAQCVEDANANSREWGIVQVEGDVVVPCEQVSQKEEYAARTIRPKVQGQLKKYLVALDHVEVTPERRTVGSQLPTTKGLTPLDVLHPDEVLKLLDVDRSVPGVSCFVGGEDAATETTKSFLEEKLARYATDRNEPSGDGGSNLSLYLRHGHVSPVDVALQVHKAKVSSKEGRDSFLEEMIVRRELAINMCVFNSEYDSMGCLPEYATITLQLHAKDKRDHLYDVDQLEKGATFDVYWNAAQLEMVHTGRMHGYMRMYWCKKILEWTKTPELGFRIALYLNNKFALDAPDPNSYTGVAWSFGKHDQGWKEQPIFGKVRYMNESGLKRKFRMDDYVAKIKRLQSQGASGQISESDLTDGSYRNTKAVKSTRSKAASKAAPTKKHKPSDKSSRPRDEADVAASMAKKRKMLEEFMASKNK